VRPYHYGAPAATAPRHPPPPPPLPLPKVMDGGIDHLWWYSLAGPITIAPHPLGRWPRRRPRPLTLLKVMDGGIDHLWWYSVAGSITIRSGAGGEQVRGGGRG
jgi:hypothetical protein